MKRSVHENFEEHLLLKPTAILHLNLALLNWFKTGRIMQTKIQPSLSSVSAGLNHSQVWRKIHFLSFLMLLTICVQAQFTTGGSRANFGIDADTRAGYSKYGPAPAVAADDWFGAAKGVIDTSNAAYFRTQLQANRNISFGANMSMPSFSQSNGRLWLDAIYMRDHSSANGKDSSAFGSSAKNGDNPNSWDISTTPVPAKGDIIDAYAHLRRDGLNITDSLWLMTGMSTQSSSGDRYLDVELYKNDFYLNKASNKFFSAGLSQGHTEWLFDGLGNVIQTGDVIIGITYPGGGIPEIEARIWVNRTTTLLFNPRLFKFGTFDGSLYGYVTVLPKSSSTSLGSAIGNISKVTAADTTAAAPWGTITKTGTWSAKYESLQFVEVGLNLSSIGIDPALYTTISNPCSKMFKSIFFKSRSSHSFTANLQDFAGPYALEAVGGQALLNLNVQSDTITCNKPVATLRISNASSIGVYNWTTLTGEIVATSDNGSTIQAKRSGLYIATGRMATGCPATVTQTVMVLADSIPPVATADITLDPMGEIQLLGGDPIASNVLTPFGRSKGLAWQWEGPNNFSSSEQNPLINIEWAWGSYYLTLEEKRNGCKARVAVDVSFRKGTMHTEASETISTGLVSPYFLRKGNSLFLVTNQNASNIGKLKIYSTSGALLSEKTVLMNNGENRIELPPIHGKEIKIVSLYIGNKLVFTRKVF